MSSSSEAVDRIGSGGQPGREELEIRQAESASEIALIRELFLEYAQSLGFSLCFQSFDQELAGLPGDPRVWSVSPRQVLVSPQPDVSSAQLYAATGVDHADPTGLIACPQPCNVHFAPAYSLYTKPVSRYAASWESSDHNFGFLLEYEFENHILNALGYDMSWR